MKALTACLVILASALAAACGQPAAKAPEPALALTGRVVDAADLLTDGQEAELSQKLAALETEVGPQFVIATTPGLQGRTIEAYSLDLARAWGIGSAAKNDGVVLLVAPRERKVRIEVGYGLEKPLPDDLCSKIIREITVPAFQQGDYPNGIARTADAIIGRLKGHRMTSLGLNAQSIRMAA